MNVKNLKYMQLFEEFVKIDFLEDSASLAKYIKHFLDLDYLLAVDVWDYLCTTREDLMATSSACADILGNTVFKLFYDRAPTKCIKAINDTLSIRKAVYQYSQKAGVNDNFIIFTDLMVNNKFENCDEILKCLIKNNSISFGETMKRSLERVFLELLKKNPAKIEMNKKLSALILTYVKKIKTEERAMLEQRLREIM